MSSPKDSPVQSPASGFTAVNGRDLPLAHLNGSAAADSRSPPPLPLSLPNTDRDSPAENGHTTTNTNTTKEDRDRDALPTNPNPDHESTTPVPENNINHNHKRKRSSSDVRRESPAASYQKGSPVPLSTEDSTPQPQHQPHHQPQQQPQQQHQQHQQHQQQPMKTNGNHAASPDREAAQQSLPPSYSLPPNSSPWGNHDAHAMNSMHPMDQHTDPSDAHLAEALQQDAQASSVRSNSVSGDAQSTHMANYAHIQPQPQSAHSGTPGPPKRKRIFSNRTKTGCMTCRRRKKKCDEQHPSCNNCIRGGFPCEGYSVRSSWGIKPSHPKGPIPLQSKDHYPEPANPYIQDVTPQQRHEPRPHLVHPDGSKARPVSVDDAERVTPQYVTSPSGTVARVAWQNGSWQSPAPQYMAEHPPKPEFREAAPVANNNNNNNNNDVTRPEQPKPEYHVVHPPPREMPPHNPHPKPGVAVFQNNIEHRPNPNPNQNPNPNHPPRMDPSNYPTQARLALNMEQHMAFEQPGKTEKGKMLSGEQYRPFDPQLLRDREHCKAALWRFVNAGNPLHGISISERTQLLKQILIPPPTEGPTEPGNNSPAGSLGPGAVVETPFNCHYGYNINIGEDVLISENCFFADDCSINIGAHTWIGPNVTILSSMAIGSMQERKGSQSRYQGRPVVIAEDCWIGAGCTILPGVTLGRGAYIAPGEVVRSQILPYGFQGLKPNYP